MLIGLTGKAGAGKDTVADILCNAGWNRYALASPIKNMLSAIGIDEPSRELKETQLEGFDFSYRKAAQTLGTEWGRAVDKDLWLKLGRQRWRGCKTSLVITDVRFDNEAEAIITDGGVIWEITGRSYNIGGVAGHLSERGIDEAFVSAKFINTGTKEDLRKMVEFVLKEGFHE